MRVFGGDFGHKIRGWEAIGQGGVALCDTVEPPGDIAPGGCGDLGDPAHVCQLGQQPVDGAAVQPRQARQPGLRQVDDQIAVRLVAQNKQQQHVIVAEPVILPGFVGHWGHFFWITSTSRP